MQTQQKINLISALEDIAVIDKPSISFFKHTYKRHTNFALENYSLQPLYNLNYSQINVNKELTYKHSYDNYKKYLENNEMNEIMQLLDKLN